MTNRARLTRIGLLLLLTPATTFAADARPLTEACEVALALSAAPERLRADASVYVLGPDGYRKAVEGQGVFTCIVERNHADSIAPQCADAAGADSVIPGIIFRSERILAGATPDEAHAEFLEKIASGELRSPARPGVSYMASNFNYIFVPARDAMRKIPPHVMFYAPNLDDAAIGGSVADARENTGMPFVFPENDPHGFMVTLLDRSSESEGVESACAGQLGPPPPPAFEDAGAHHAD